MANMQNDFTGWDYAVFVALLIGSMGIGIYFAIKGRKADNQDEYLLADRSLGILPVSVSILVSYTSAIAILGTPAEVYSQGSQFYLNIFGEMAGACIAAFVYVPLLYPLNITSSFEYLELRFQSRAVRLLGTIFMIIMQVVYMGIASFAPSTALEAFTGFPVWASILIGEFVATIYTSIGGMRAVVWTDAFQACIMFASLLAVNIQGTIKIGGVGKVWDIASRWERTEFINNSNYWNFDPTVRHTVWGLSIGSTLQWMGVYGVMQASVQRYCSLSSLSKAKICLLLSIPGLFIEGTMLMFSGLVLFAYFADKDCDPLGEKLVDSPNQLIPYLVMDIMAYPGIPGLFIASLFSGSLSSVSSSLNALAAITWEDILKPYLRHRMSEAKQTWVTKLLVVFYGCCAVVVAFFVDSLKGTVLQASLALLGATGAPITGLFVLGAFFPCVNNWGAISGAIVAFCVSMWLSMGAYITELPLKKLDFPNGTCEAEVLNETSLTTMTTLVLANVNTATKSLVVEETTVKSGFETFYSISYMWYTTLSLSIMITVGLLVSFITVALGVSPVQEVPAKYQIQLFSRLFCWCPDRVINLFNRKKNRAH